MTHASTARRRRLLPGQGRLLVAAAMLAVGGMLPWVYTAAGPASGLRGGGLWVLYAGLLALAGGLIPRRTLAMVQAVVCAVPALVLPVWQVVHVVGLVGTSGWAPGPGLVVSAGGGVLCLVAARQLHAVDPA